MLDAPLQVDADVLLRPVHDIENNPVLANARGAVKDGDATLKAHSREWKGRSAARTWRVGPV